MRYARGKSSHASDQRKTLQLCRQVERALMFVLSDSLLGIRKFVQPRLDLQPALLLSYWAAIGLIAVSA